MEADNIAGGKEPKRLPVWACIPLFIVILFILLGLYGTLARGCLSLVLGVEARHPGVMGYIILEASMLLAVLTAAIPMLRFERRPFSDLGLSLKGHVKGLWYGFLMAILLYLFGFGISFVLGEIEVTGFQFKPLDLLGSWVFFLLVALFEEILMRGYILGRLLHTTMNKFLALFVSAALFAFYAHLQSRNSFPAYAQPVAGRYAAGSFLSIYAEPVFSYLASSFLELDSRPHPRLSGKRKQLHHQYADFAYARRKRTEWRSLRF